MPYVDHPAVDKMFDDGPHCGKYYSEVFETCPRYCRLLRFVAASPLVDRSAAHFEARFAAYLRDAFMHGNYHVHPESCAPSMVARREQQWAQLFAQREIPQRATPEFGLGVPPWLLTAAQFNALERSRSAPSRSAPSALSRGGRR